MKTKLILLLLLITACTTQTCPQVACPETQEQQQEDIQLMTIHRINVGNEDVYITYTNDIADIYNCGDRAHGPVTVQEIKKIFNDNNLNYNTMHITNTTRDYIGGCPELFRELPGINNIYVYGTVRDTKEYEDLIIWAPLSKLKIFKDTSYVLMFNGNKIDFDKVIYDTTVTDGITYEPKP